MLDIKVLKISRNKQPKEKKEEAKPGKRTKIFYYLKTLTLFLQLLPAELQNLRKLKQSKALTFPT